MTGNTAKQKIGTAMSSYEIESISERCRRTGTQCCHICEHPTCGDNTSELKQQVRRMERSHRIVTQIEVMACPVCGSDPGVNIDCPWCHWWTDISEPDGVVCRG